MKTNYIFFIGVSLFTSLVFSQVGIGTVAPDGALDVVSTTDGLLIPRVALTATNVATVVTPIESELVYNTFDSAPGANAVSKGYYYWNGSLWVKLATGASNDDWTLTGNTGTSSATNFIGTFDDVDFAFRRNNLRAGYIGNPASGALPTTPNFKNTSFGANSLLNPGLGYRNTAIGSNVMTVNTGGNRNVAIGDAAMASNTDGQQNTAIGVGALFSNTIGNSNVAIGRNALTATNTAVIGTQASGNTAIGMTAMELNSIGALNSAVGRESLYNNTTGNNNTGLGYRSGFSNATGNNNVFLGNQAGFSELTSNKLYIENSNADANNSLIYGEFDTNVLRTNSTFQIGNPAVTGYSFPTARPAAVAGQVLQYTVAGGLTFQTPAAALNSSAWLTTGNSGMLAASNYIGTSDANPLVFRTAAIDRMRVTATGEFAVGTGTPFAGDKITAYATGTQAAIRGESTLGGRGVIGFNNGTGIATQGQNSSTGVGVFGINTSTGVGIQGQSGNLNGSAIVGFNTTASGNGTGVGVAGQIAQRDGVGVLGFNNGPAGTDFGWLFGGSRASVFGNGNPTGSFSFGVMGDGGTSTRSGGVFGDDFGTARSALGYFSAGFTDYAVYGFGNVYEVGIPGGRPINSDTNVSNNMIGIGIYGGVMGGWVRGMNYGLHAKGKEYGMYVDGNTITNKPIIQLIENGKEKRSIAFTTTSMTADVYVRGNNRLINGSIYITFKEDFSDIISDKIPINITITPTGESKGVYITDISNKGFRVIENGNGNSNVAINWVAYGTRLGYENPDEIVSDEILSTKFDENMDAVMYNDSNKDGNEKGIWYDGNKVKIGKTPASFLQAKLSKKKTKEIPKIQTFEADSK